MAANCEWCGAEVDWITVPKAAAVLQVSDRRIRQLLKDGRFPGAVKFRPPHDVPFWKIPLASVAAFHNTRR